MIVPLLGGDFRLFGCHNRPATASGGKSIPGQGWRVAGDRPEQPTKKARIGVLDFEKRSVFPSRFVGAEMEHDTECRGAFERTGKARTRHREIDLRCPMRELRRVEKKTSRMRIVD